MKSNVRFATIEDIEEIKKIIDEGISQDYYSLDDIEEYITNESKYLLVVTSEDNKPLAAMFCIKGRLIDMCKNEHIPFSDDVFSKYTEDTKTIVYKTASTYKNVRNNGYVGMLFEEYNTIFNNIDHDLRIGLAIVYPDGKIPIKKHVDAYNFKPVKLFKHPWNSLKSYCSYCGKEYCECDGLLYIKESISEQQI